VRNLHYDSHVTVGAVATIVIAIIAIAVMLLFAVITSGCYPYDEDIDGGELMDEYGDSEMNGDSDLNLPPIITEPENSVMDTELSKLVFIDPASCNELTHIAGDWYNTETTMVMTVTITPEIGNMCVVNFTGNGTLAFLKGDYQGKNLPLVKTGSCGWLIATILSNGNLIQSGYA